MQIAKKFNAHKYVFCGAIASGLYLINMAFGVPTPPTAPFDNDGNGVNPTFSDDRVTFEKVEDILHDGLGPVYNSNSCAACHQNPVTGSSSEIQEIRAGHFSHQKGANGSEVLTFVPHVNGSLVHQRAINPAVQQHVQAEDLIRTFRMSNTILGDGYVECIDDLALIQNVQNQVGTKFGDLRGTIVFTAASIKAPDVGANPPVAGTSEERVGRFGWKCQHSSLLDFAADAYINEMGVTSPLQPNEDPSDFVDVKDFDPVPDPEDTTVEDGKPNEVHPFGGDIQAFARFMRGTNVPPRSDKGKNAAEIDAGEVLFRNNQKVGCAICHTPDWKTMDAGTPIAGYFVFTQPPTGTVPSSVVPEQLGGKTIHPFSDFLMHNVGTGDGIVQTQHAQFPSLNAYHPKRFVLPASIKPMFSARVDAAGLRTAPIDAFHLMDFLPPLPSSSKLKVPATPVESLDNLTHTQAIGIQAQPNTPDTDQNQEIVKTAMMLRTAPLWGLRVRPRLLHDGSALTIEDAIMRHGGQAEQVKVNYAHVLTEKERGELIAFLNSL